MLHSVDFAEIEQCQRDGRWEQSAGMLLDAARGLVAAGAQLMVLCTNTMHKNFDQVQSAVSVPLIHIADATAKVIQQQGLKKVGLLGSTYTMEQDFYKKKVIQAGIDVIIPEQEERKEISRVIYEELAFGVMSKTSKEYYLQVVKNLSARGCEGIIMGCTEIGLLLQQQDTSIPLFDTTEIHATSAVSLALENHQA